MQINLTYILTVAFIAVLSLSSCDSNKADQDNTHQIKSPNKKVIPESAEMADLSQAKKFNEILKSQDPKKLQDALKVSGSLGTLNITFKVGNEKKRLRLNEYIGQTLSKKMSLIKEPLRVEDYRNDDNEQLLKVDSKEVSYKINASTSMISDIKITSSDVVLNGKSISLKVGDYANGIGKYYPGQFKKRKKITRNGKSIETVLIPISEFSSVKSDTYIYADIDSEGRIVELGSWEQY